MPFFYISHLLRNLCTLGERWTIALLYRQKTSLQQWRIARENSIGFLLIDEQFFKQMALYSRYLIQWLKFLFKSGYLKVFFILLFLIFQLIRELSLLNFFWVMIFSIEHVGEPEMDSTLQGSHPMYFFSSAEVIPGQKHLSLTRPLVPW